MSIFINYSLSVSYSSLPNMGLGCYMFPSINSVVVDFLLAFWGYGGLYLCCFSFLSFFFFFFFFFFVSGSKAKIKVSSLGKWRPFVSFNGGFGQFLQLFFFDFSEPDLHNLVAFFKALALSRVLLRWPISVVGVWRVAYTHQRAHCSLAPVTATLHHFLAVHDGDGGYGGRWLIYGWVVPVTARVLHAPPSPAKSVPASSTGSLVFLVFLLYVVYSLVFSYTVCMCIAQNLLKFLLDKC
jgi:hypothetical protein